MQNQTIKSPNCGTSIDVSVLSLTSNLLGKYIEGSLLDVI